MKKVLTTALLYAEIAAFGMLMILFSINTTRLYLLLFPVVMGAGGYFAFAAIMRKLRDSSTGKKVRIAAALPVLLGIMISASVIGLLYLL